MHYAQFCHIYEYCNSIHLHPVQYVILTFGNDVPFPITIEVLPSLSPMDFFITTSTSAPITLSLSPLFLSSLFSLHSSQLSSSFLTFFSVVTSSILPLAMVQLTEVEGGESLWPRLFVGAITLQTIGFNTFDSGNPPSCFLSQMIRLFNWINFFLRELACLYDYFYR